MNFEVDDCRDTTRGDGKISTICDFWVGDIECDQEVVECFWGDRLLWGLIFWGLDLYAIHSSPPSSAKNV